MIIPIDYANAFIELGIAINALPEISDDEAAEGIVDAPIMKIIDRLGVPYGFSFQLRKTEIGSGRTLSENVILLYEKEPRIPWSQGGWKTQEVFHNRMKIDIRETAEICEYDPPFISQEEAMTPDCIKRLVRKEYVGVDGENQFVIE